jgi:tetratricopeptide (TPR) repeat protein
MNESKCFTTNNGTNKRMIRKPPISVYTPSMMDAETRQRIFVQRHQLLRKAVRWCEESMLTGNKHHLLFIGPRGSGKTHLVSMMHDRVSQNPKLADKMRIAWLGEDTVFTGLIDLALEIADELARAYPDEFQFDYRANARGGPPNDAAEQILSEIVKRLGTKSILLIMENLDRAMRGLGDLGQKKWRAFLQEQERVATVATSQQLFESVSSRNAAFYGFFELIHLEPLSVEDAQELMKKIAREHDKLELVQFLTTPEGRYRVRALRHLAGGNHRMYVMLSEFLTKESLDGLVACFEELADELTPYFQERIRSLSPQQGRIVQSLCGAEGAMTVKQMAEETFIAERNVSKHLGELKQKGYVVSEKRGKESYYDMAEPLMRLCLEVKKQRGEPLKLVAAFLRVWFSDDLLQGELGGEVATSIHDARCLEYKKIALGLNDAFRQDIELSLADEFESNMKSRQFHEAMSNAEELVCTNRPAGLICMSWVHREKGQLTEALEEIEEAISSRELDDTQKSEALYHRGTIHTELGDSKKAIADFSGVIGMEVTAVDTKARALFFRGNMHAELEDLERATNDYSAVIGLEGAPVDQKARAFVNRGNMHGRRRAYEKAIGDHTAAIQMKHAPVEARAMALVNRGIAYSECGDSEKAIGDYSAVIEMEDALVDQKIKALSNRGLAYRQSSEVEKAIDDYSTLIEMKQAPIDQKAVALLLRSNAYGELRETEMEIADCTAVIQMKHAPLDQRAMALFCRANAHRKKGDFQRTIADSTAVIEMQEAPIDHRAWALLIRGDQYWRLQQFELSANDYEAAATVTGASSAVNTAALFCVPEALVPIKPVDQSIQSLVQAFERGGREESSYGGTPKDILRMILLREHQSWPEFIEKLTPIYAEYGALDKLGSGLTESIAALDEGDYSKSQLDLWNSSWQEFGREHEELSIPLDALEAAVQVIKTGDDRPLFKLPLEIRKIVRPLLKNTLSEE